MSFPLRPASWQRVMPGLLLLAAMLWLLRDTAAAMVAIWIRSETFTHAFLVLPIVLWLVWRRRHDLASLPLRPVPWLLVPITAVCFLWLLGELAAVAAASQFALVTLVVLSVPATFGWRVARTLTFPLLFLYFAVPLGEFTVPTLMDWTADFTVLALQFTGIPVYREGLQFVIPSGTWSVVEACSGVRYLIASFMVGLLFAYLNYRSMKRRLIFGLFSLVVPIVANWLRAYMIVMIGHLSDNTLAVGVDHLIYGWVFFGLVIGLMFFVGARWAEAEAPAPSVDTAAVHPSAPGRHWLVAASALLILAGAQVWAWRLTQVDMRSEATSIRFELPESRWQAASEPLPWRPGFQKPSAVYEQQFGAGPQSVWVWIAYYRQQSADRKLVSTVNELVASDDRGWSQIERGSRAPAAGLPGFRTGTLRRGSALAGVESTRLRVWHLYWVGGRWTTSDAAAKVWQAFDRLRGHGDDGAVVLFVAPQDTDADAVLEEFARTTLRPIGAALSSARDNSRLTQ